MKEKKKIQYEAWSKHLEVTKERTLYSSRRMDLLTITFCGAGIYIIFETLKEINKKTLIVDDILILKLSGLFFLISIILNFISQHTAYKANKLEEEYVTIKLEKIKGEEIDKKELKETDKKVDSFDKATGVLNFCSTIFMLIGLILIAIFNYSLF